MGKGANSCYIKERIHTERHTQVYLSAGIWSSAFLGLIRQDLLPCFWPLPTLTVLFGVSSRPALRPPYSGKGCSDPSTVVRWRRPCCGLLLPYQSMQHTFTNWTLLKIISQLFCEMLLNLCECVCVCYFHMIRFRLCIFYNIQEYHRGEAVFLDTQCPVV